VTAVDDTAAPMSESTCVSMPDPMSASMAEPVMRGLPRQGVLVRYGDLVLFCAPGAGQYPRLGTLIGAVATAAGSPDGARQMSRLLGGLLSGAGPDDFPSLCAFGPTGGGLVAIVYGQAELTSTVEGRELRLDGRDAVTVVDRIISGPIAFLRAAVDGGAGLLEMDWTRPSESMMDHGSSAESMLDHGTSAESMLDHGGAASVAAPVVESPPAPPPAPPVVESPPVVAPVAESPPAPAAPPAAVPPAPPPVVESPPVSPAVPPASPANGSTPATAAATVVTPGPIAAAGPVAAAEPLAASSPVALADPPISAPITVARPVVPQLLAPDLIAPDLVAPERPAPTRTDPVQVIGVRCKNGHFNDPKMAHCAVCGILMASSDRQLVIGERPQLGVLVVDDGTVSPLVLDHVVGRMPESDTAVAAGLASAVRLIDPLVSAVHARVVLDGWEVRVVDAGSVIGTFVCGPGETAWTPLSSGDSALLRPGTVVAFGRRQLCYHSYRNAVNHPAEQAL